MGGGGGGQQTTTTKSSNQLPAWEQPVAKEYLSSILGYVFPGSTVPDSWFSTKGFSAPSAGGGSGTGAGATGGTGNSPTGTDAAAALAALNAIGPNKTTLQALSGVGGPGGAATQPANTGGSGGSGAAQMLNQIDPTGTAYSMFAPMLAGSPYLQNMASQNPAAVVGATSPLAASQLGGGNLYGNTNNALSWIPGYQSGLGITPPAAQAPPPSSTPADRGAAFLSPGQQPGQVWSTEQGKYITPKNPQSYGLAGATPVYGQSLAQMQANGLSSFGNTPPGMIWSTVQGKYVPNPMPNAPAKPGVSTPPGMTWSTVQGKYVPLAPTLSQATSPAQLVQQQQAAAAAKKPAAAKKKK